jgi:cytoskeletal protein CcmA (bactofilin family)
MMFTRESKLARIDTLIGKAARVRGDVEFAGGLHLDGSIVGNVRSDQAPGSALSVSQGGSIGTFGWTARSKVIFMPWSASCLGRRPG